MRQWILFIFSIFAFLGSGIAAIATTTARNSELQGYVDPITESNQLPFRVPIAGINQNLLLLNDTALYAQLDELSASGIVWLRQSVNWTELEVEQARFEWEAWDRLMLAVEDYPALRVLPVFTGMSQWSESNTLEQNTVNYADFVTQFVSRYAQSIDYYQIIGPASQTPADYVNLLEALYRIIHQIDPQAYILSAEFPSSNALAEFYALHGGEFVDAIATVLDINIQPEFDPQASNFSNLLSLRDVMLVHGDATKAIWITQTELVDIVTVDRFQSTVTQLYTHWPWIGSLILSEDTSIDYLANFNVINGLYPAQVEFARYSGIWNFDDQSADAGWVNDSHVELTFRGTDIAVLVREWDYSTYFYADVDDIPANALPQDSAGNAYLLLTSDTLTEQINTVPLAKNLTEEEHTLTIVVHELIPDAPTPTYPLMGFALRANDYRSPYNQQITVAWVTTIVALISTLFTFTQLPIRNILQKNFLPYWMSYPIKLALSTIASILLMLGMLLTWSTATPHIFRRDEVQILLSIATAGLIYLEPPFMVAIIASLFLFIIFYNHLEIGLMLTLFWSPFFLFPVELYRFAFPTAEIILIITIGAWTLRMGSSWAQRFKQRGYIIRNVELRFRDLQLLDYAVISWVMLSIMALIWSDYRGVAVTELRTIFIQPALFYAVFRTLPHQRKLSINLVDALLLAGLAVAIIGLFQYARGEAIIEAEGGAGRLASVYGSPNNVSLFLGRCFPFALAFTLIPTDGFRRYFAGTTLAIFALALLLTQSVGALLIGIPTTICALFIFIYGRRAFVPLVFLSIVFAIGLIVALQFPRFNNVLDFSQGTNFYRLRVWDSGINIIEDHPITGIGLDQFLYAFRGQYIMPDAWQEPNLSHPHNFMLDIWIRLGIFGILWFIVTQIIFWRAMYKNSVRLIKSDPLFYALILGGMGAMINLLMHGMVDNSLFVIDLAYVFMTLLALASLRPNISAIDVTS